MASIRILSILAVSASLASFSSLAIGQQSDTLQLADSLVDKWRLEEVRTIMVEEKWAQRPDSLLDELKYPVRFDSVSVVGFDREDVTRIYDRGYFRENEGFQGGATFYTDPNRSVVLRIEWGTDWALSQLSFSNGEREDLPDSIPSIKGLPTSAISLRINSTLSLEGIIRLGMSPRDLFEHYGKPHLDTLQLGYRLISYETDDTRTKKVHFYEAWFRFKDDNLIRFKIYNGD